MQLSIEFPNNYIEERQYISSIIFSEFLGIDINILFSERRNVRISANDHYEIIIADSLFGTPEGNWLKPESLPARPLKIWNLELTPFKNITIDHHIPIIYGENPEQTDFLVISEKSIKLGLDIFGSAFFMLTRYEEYVSPKLDSRQRFLGRFSLAYQENFLDRPIINEYLELLWWSIQTLWPNLKRKSRQYQVMLTHDVDVPFATLGMPKAFILRSLGADLLLRHNLPLAYQRVHSFFKGLSGDYSIDPYNTFDLLMDISEKYNLVSYFYFITGKSSNLDSFYSLDDLFIRKLIKQISQRGHQIGLHPSYNSFRDFNCISQEFNKLLQVTQDEGVCQQNWGGRQHYLRWEVPTTWQYWEDAGLNYDSSVGFVDVAGFRCGTCYEFSVFNLLTRQHLKLKEYPLMAMEMTLFCQNDGEAILMNLSPEEAINFLRLIAERTKKFQGIFTFLWHNNSWLQFDQPNHQLYRRLLEAITL